jgi:hypothetical protein
VACIGDQGQRARQVAKQSFDQSECQIERYTDCEGAAIVRWLVMVLVRYGGGILSYQ